MRSLLKSTLLFLFPILLFSSCYEPNGTSYVEVEKPKPPESVSIDFSAPGDTIYWVAGTNLNFSYSAGGAELRWAHCVFDTSDYSYWDCVVSNNSFYMYTTNGLKQGIHAMDVYIFTKSYTGSLADLMNAEGFLAKRRWVLVYMNKESATPIIKSTSIEAGALRIDWEAESAYYASCFVQKNGTAINEWITVDTVYGYGNNFGYDETYVGEECTYRIVGNIPNNASIYSKEYYCTSRIPQVKEQSIELNNNYTLQWNRSPFDKGFKCYRISIYPKDPVYIYDINQTSYTVPTKSDFNSEQYTLTVVPNSQSVDFVDPGSKFSTSGKHVGGTKLPYVLYDWNQSYSTPVFVGTARGNTFYIVRSGSGTTDYTFSLVAYDPSSNTIVFQIIVPFMLGTLSFDGKYVLNYSSSSFCIIDMDTKTISPAQSYYTVQSDIYNVKNPTISDNGIVAFAHTYGCTVYNAIEKKVIGKMYVSTPIARISPNGEYMVIHNDNTSVYRIHPDKIETLKWDADNYSLKYVQSCGFVSNSEFVYAMYSTINKIDLNTMSTTKSYNIKSATKVLFDLQNSKYCTQELDADCSKMKVYDLNTEAYEGMATRQSSYDTYYILSFPYIINASTSLTRIYQ